MKAFHHKGESMVIMLTVRWNCTRYCCFVHVYVLSLGFIGLRQHYWREWGHLFIGRISLHIVCFLSCLSIFWFEGEQSKTLLLTVVSPHRSQWRLFEEVVLHWRCLWGCCDLVKGRLIPLLGQFLNDRDESVLILLCFLEVIFQHWNPASKHLEGIFLSLTIFEGYVVIILWQSVLLHISSVIRR